MAACCYSHPVSNVCLGVKVIKLLEGQDLKTKDYKINIKDGQLSARFNQKKNVNRIFLEQQDQCPNQV